MKRFLKVFSSLCLVLLVGATVLLSGCAKNCIVSVSATAGGKVLERAKEDKKLDGDHEIEKGESFEFVINADTGYYIKSVSVNDKEVDMSTWAADEEDGYITYHIHTVEDINADTKIHVTFEAKVKTITLNFVEDSENTVIPVKVQKYNIPCFKKFELFKDDQKTIFYEKKLNGTFSELTELTLRGKDATIYVKVAADKVDVVIAKLDAEVFNTENGCTKVQ